MGTEEDKLALLAAAAEAALLTPTASPTAPGGKREASGCNSTGTAPVRTKVRLVVEDQNGGTVEFSVKPSTQMKRITDAYAQKKNIDPNALRFTFDGTRFSPDTTVERLGLEVRHHAQSHSPHVASRAPLSRAFVAAVPSCDRVRLALWRAGWRRAPHVH